MPTTEKTWTYRGARGIQPLVGTTTQQVPDIRETQVAIANNADTPAPTVNTAMATVWVLDVHAFRSLEDAFLADGSYESRLDDHRRSLATLIAQGEQLVAAVKESGLMAGTEKSKFSLSDLVATLDSLHTAFDCEYRPRITPKNKHTVESLFDGPKS